MRREKYIQLLKQILSKTLHLHESQLLDLNYLTTFDTAPNSEKATSCFSCLRERIKFKMYNFENRTVTCWVPFLIYSISKNIPSFLSIRYKLHNPTKEFSRKPFDVIMASYARTARRQSGVDIWSNAGPNNSGKVGSVDKFDFTSPSMILKQLVNKASICMCTWNAAGCWVVGDKPTKNTNIILGCWLQTCKYANMQTCKHANWFKCLLLPKCWTLFTRFTFFCGLFLLLQASVISLSAWKAFVNSKLIRMRAWEAILTSNVFSRKFWVV